MFNTIIPCPVCPGFVTVSQLCVCDKCGPVPRRMYQNLRETKKQDREVMLSAMVRLCERFGINHAVDRCFLGRKRAMAIGIRSPDGLRVTIDFDGESCQPDVFVVSWNMMPATSEPNTVIADDFAQSINQYHFKKATDVCLGFNQLIAVMSERLQRIAAGTATRKLEKIPAKAAVRAM